jgi:fructose-1,6-bisphosphatase/inositol monophosphatase family enzyme
MAKEGRRQQAERRRKPFPWRQSVREGLQAASAVVRRLAPGAGQRVVRGREAGYRPWDPEVIGVDTAAERAMIAALRRRGVRGTLLSEEVGETPLRSRADRTGAGTDPVYVIQDPFDGSLLYRRGIRAHWFSALGIYGQDEQPRAAGVVDHITGEIVLADAAGATRLARPGARPVPVRPATTAKLDGAFLETYLGKPSFLYPTATALRPLFERARFILGNGGPCGFADVACGRIDVYFAWNEALTEVFSAIYIAERAGCPVSHWDGSPVRFRPDIHAVYSLVCSANPRLHEQVLRALQGITPPKGL